DLPHRRPVHPGRLHRDMRDPARRQPRQQRQQTLGRRRESPALPRRLAGGHQPHASHDRLLMHIQPSYTLMHYLHAVSSPPGWGPPTKRNLTSALRGGRNGVELIGLWLVGHFSDSRIECLDSSLQRTLRARPPSHRSPPPAHVPEPRRPPRWSPPEPRW